jgi:hypothetical protein
LLHEPKTAELYSRLTDRRNGGIAIRYRDELEAELHGATELETLYYIGRQMVMDGDDSIPESVKEHHRLNITRGEKYTV